MRQTGDSTSEMLWRGRLQCAKWGCAFLLMLEQIFATYDKICKFYTSCFACKISMTERGYWTAFNNGPYFYYIRQVAKSRILGALLSSQTYYYYFALYRNILNNDDNYNVDTDCGNFWPLNFAFHTACRKCDSDKTVADNLRIRLYRLPCVSYQQGFIQTP